MREMTYIGAIQAGMEQVLREDPSVVVFGQDVGGFGGAFKATEGLQKQFGEDRVFDTPICESAMLGLALGLASQGMRPIVEMQFADFATTAIHQLLNNAGTMHYRTGVSASMTVRAPCGGGMGGGPFHSEELEAIFCHMPGIKVVYPATSADARGLLLAAVQDPDPVIFLENKYLYRREKQLLPKHGDPVPIGQASVVRNGYDACVLTYGAMVPETLHAASHLSAEENYEVMVVDLRSLKPYDEETIIAAVAATSRVLIVHEGWRTCGFGAELAALIAEKAFHLLDAPVRRVTAPDVPVPFARELEDVYRPHADTIAQALIELIEF
ncbi:MAG: alpha-ketoacid dehydrogenase subunit beta [Lentisphaeria bacterium]|nr:alpha-ketoacid dehydrogenase subunit beta [Lentisphaeria bacterium]